MRPRRGHLARPLAVLLAALASLALAACGGGGKSSTSSSAASTTSTSSKTPSKRHSNKHFALAETVQVSKSSTPAAGSATAGAGDSVAFRTRVPGTSSSKRVKVKVTISRTSPSKWTAVAAVNGKQATATLTGSGGKAITLERLHYTCTLPPTPSFCPAHQVVSSAKATTVHFSTTPTVPVSVAAVVGPTPGATTAKAPGTVVVPAYSVTALVADRAQSATSATSPAATAKAKPGDEVVLKTKLKGASGGAPQAVTITFDQGPAKTLNVSAGVPGAPSSKATIVSGSGAPITLVLPRYACYLAPAPTFCPPSKAAAASHRYSVTFPGSPTTPPAISAAVSAG